MYLYKRGRTRKFKRIAFWGSGAIGVLVIVFNLLRIGLIRKPIFNFQEMERRSQSTLLSIVKKGREVVESVQSRQSENDTKKVVTYRIGVISDSHGSTDNIKKAVYQMGIFPVDLIIHLGDFTAGGERESFEEAKEVLTNSSIPYYVLPGDHDFNWYPEHSRSNFESVFGHSYHQVHDLGTIGIIMYENSVQLEADTNELKWIESAIKELSQSTQQILFFSARPLYTPYFQTKSDEDGETVIELLSDNNITHAYAGDTHLFAEYQDIQERIDLVSVGAVGEYKNPIPQWLLIEVFNDGTVKSTPQPLVDF